jgi:hypothetical protein
MSMLPAATMIKLFRSCDGREIVEEAAGEIDQGMAELFLDAEVRMGEILQRIR